jgi:hypothetical protein
MAAPPVSHPSIFRKELTPMVRKPEPDRDGPTAEDLAAIEREWPLIEAELALLDAEIRELTAVGGPSPLDRRRVRRAEKRVMREAAALLSHPTAAPDLDAA